jgi:membrane associated rhomboid family serine protease
MTEPPSEAAGELPPAPVFRGSQAESLEYGLVLEARGIAYERSVADGLWLLTVAPPLAEAAADELSRYAGERAVRREAPAPFVPIPGSGVGAAAYAFVLILVAYCAGIETFGVDWLDAGALQSGPGTAWEWWRAVTALTLHLDQEHLLGNLLFGIGIGTLAGRMFGPGCAWLGILLSGAAANWIDMWVSPSGHRAVGASTAVFAALGMLAGFGWGERRGLRERRLYRWAPLFAGLCLLALLGAGSERVDVLGHLLGFITGTAAGWSFAHAGMPRIRNASLQIMAGVAAAMLLGVAWFIALSAARRTPF